MQCPPPLNTRQYKDLIYKPFSWGIRGDTEYTLKGGGIFLYPLRAGEKKGFLLNIGKERKRALNSGKKTVYNLALHKPLCTS